MQPKEYPPTPGRQLFPDIVSVGANRCLDGKLGKLYVSFTYCYFFYWLNDAIKYSHSVVFRINILFCVLI